MKTFRTMFLTALCGAGALYANDSDDFAESPAPTLSVFRDRPSRFQIGGNYTYVNIKPNGANALNGNLGGAQGMYEYRPINSFYGALKGLWRQGNTSSDQMDRYLIDIDVQERFGYTIATGNDRYLTTLFTGFGYRYLGNKLTDGSSTIELNYNEFYVPVGFLVDYAVNSILSLGLYVTWMPQVDPTVTLVPIQGAQWVLQKRLVNFLVEMPLTLSTCSNKEFSIVIKPFYEFWQDGTTLARTTSNVPLGLPENTYNFAGVEINFGYQF